MHQQCSWKSSLCHMHCSCVSAPQIHNWFCLQRKDAISHQSLVSSLMGSSWCNDTAGFDTLVVDKEGGSEGRQCSTEGLLLWKVLNIRATSFADSFHSLIVPDREVFQPEKWWKPHQRQPWHGMAQHDFCLMCWGLTSLCISKGKLDKRIALTEIQSWYFYHHHPWRWKLPLHAVLPQIFTYMSNSMLVQKGNFKVQCILHETRKLHYSQQ